MKILSGFSLALVLAFAGCGKTTPKISVHDEDVRALLQIHSLSATYSIPAKEKFLAVIVLKFKNGKLVGEPLGCGFGSKSIPKRQLHVEFDWRKANGKTTAIFTGLPSRTLIQDSFFSNFMQNYALAPNLESNVEKGQRFQEWKILAFAQTTGLDGKSLAFGTDEDFAACLRICKREKQDAFAIAVRGFPTFKAAREAMTKKGNKSSQLAK